MTLKANSDTASGLDGQSVPTPLERVRTRVAEYEAGGGTDASRTAVGEQTDRVPAMKISAQFATSLSSAEHIVAAEQLGYDRAWLFDTPHQSPDVWMMLALAAQRTTGIGFGPRVLLPRLRP